MDRNDLREIAEKQRGSRKPIRVRCCTASGCAAVGAVNVKKTLEESVADHKLTDRVEVLGVGCLGLCGRGPLVQMDPDGLMAEQVC